MKEIECPIPGANLQLYGRKNKLIYEVDKDDKLICYEYKEFIALVYKRYHRPYFIIYGKGMGTYFPLFHNRGWPHLTKNLEIEKDAKNYIYINLKKLQKQLTESILAKVL